MATNRKRYFKYIKVMLTDEQKELVSNEADRLGLTDSDVLRLLIKTLENK
jgi:antitoxin component of RelBE/YafQ-DinJ toxin-antitoxin module